MLKVGWMNNRWMESREREQERDGLLSSLYLIILFEVTSIYMGKDWVKIG